MNVNDTGTRFSLVSKSLHCCWVTQSCLTFNDPVNCSMPGFLVLYYPEFAPVHVHWVDNAIQPSHLLLPPSLPAPDLSVWVFSNESALWVRWPKYWSFSISISPSNENSWLISFRIAWLDFAVQGTLKSLLQNNSLKASILWHSVFFMVQLSHPYMTW